MFALVMLIILLIVKALIVAALIKAAGTARRDAGEVTRLLRRPPRPPISPSRLEQLQREARLWRNSHPSDN